MQIRVAVFAQTTHVELSLAGIIVQVQFTPRQQSDPSGVGVYLQLTRVSPWKIRMDNFHTVSPICANYLTCGEV